MFFFYVSVQCWFLVLVNQCLKFLLFCYGLVLCCRVEKVLGVGGFYFLILLSFLLWGSSGIFKHANLYLFFYFQVVHLSLGRIFWSIDSSWCSFWHFIQFYDVLRELWNKPINSLTFLSHSTLSDLLYWSESSYTFLDFTEFLQHFLGADKEMTRQIFIPYYWRYFIVFLVLNSSFKCSYTDKMINR